MLIARYRQQPFDVRKRAVNYTAWLEDAETISGAPIINVTPVTTTPLVISNILVDPLGKLMAFYAGGGEAGTTYKLDIQITTSAAQQREDEIEIEVEDI